MVTTDEEEIEITCATDGLTIRITVHEAKTGARNTFSVESTDLTKNLVQQLLASAFELDLLSGVRDTHSYRRTLFRALVGISNCQ
tara:strand:+ start:349 stop:603 length:255 start_codon:yes stop_codon:yes gene_type:complete